MLAPALLLNADFRPLRPYPLSLLSGRDTIYGLLKGTHAPVAFYDREVRSPSITIQLPSVVALRRYRAVPSVPAFTRFNVFLRDRFRCQYCGGRFDSRDLTFDHVVPRCAGGPTDWTNIVAACLDCNARKDAKHLNPLTKPKRPSAWQLARAYQEVQPYRLHETWLDYLYWDVELK